MVQVNTSSWILAEIIITSLNIFTFDLVFESNSYNAKITVIITAYNRSKFVDKAILSVINQTLVSELYEIVVVGIRFEYQVKGKYVQRCYNNFC